MEPAAAPVRAGAHPLVHPGPAVGGDEPGQPLVLQQRRDGGVVELAQLPLAGGAGLEARGVQGAQQLGRGVGVEAGGAEERTDLLGERLEPGGPGAARRARAEQRGEQPVVDLAGPRAGRRGASPRRRGRRRTRRRAAAAAGRGPAPRRPPACWRASSARTSAGSHPPRSSSRVGAWSAASHAPAASQGPAGAAASGEAAVAAACRRMAWHRRRSWQRSTRTPAVRRAG